MTDRQTDGRTDRRTDRRTGKNNMSPDPEVGRHNIDFSNTQGQITPQSEVGSGRNSNSSELL